MIRAATIAAAVLAVAATSAFAAPRTTHPVSQGEAYNVCRSTLYPGTGMDDYHKQPVIEACVTRVMQGGSAD